MIRFALRALFTCLVLASLCFAMAEVLPGDAAMRIAVARYDAEAATPEAAAQVRAELGLDRPAPARLLAWLGALGTGELGRSMVSGAPVVAAVATPVARSLALVACAWPVTLLVGLLLGVALSRTRAGLALAQALGALAAGTPSYVLGLLLGLGLAIQLRLLPVAGHGTPAHLVLPALTLGLLGGLRLALVTAAACAAAAAHPSVAFARMKGHAEPAVLFRHVLPLAAAPVLGFAFVGLAGLLEGAAVIETLFAYPGMGKTLVDAVLARDVPVIQALALAIGVLVVACNAMAEALVGRLDPAAPR